MTAATKKAPARKPADEFAGLPPAGAGPSGTRARRGQAQHEARAGIDAAAERIRQVRKDLGARARDEAGQMQTRLEQASEDALREFGRAAVRAQRTPEALTEMQTEIRARKRTLLV